MIIVAMATARAMMSYEGQSVCFATHLRTVSYIGCIRFQDQRPENAFGRFLFITPLRSANSQDRPCRFTSLRSKPHSFFSLSYSSIEVGDKGPLPGQPSFLAEWPLTIVRDKSIVLHTSAQRFSLFASSRTRYLELVSRPRLVHSILSR